MAEVLLQRTPQRPLRLLVPSRSVPRRVEQGAERDAHDLARLETEPLALYSKVCLVKFLARFGLRAPAFEPLVPLDPVLVGPPQDPLPPDDPVCVPDVARRDATFLHDSTSSLISASASTQRYPLPLPDALDRTS